MTTQPNAGQSNAGPVIQAFSEALSDSMQNLAETQQQFHNDWNRDSSVLNDEMAQAVNRMRSRGKPPLSNDLKALVETLQRFPQLVPVVNNLVARCIAEVAAETEKIFAKYSQSGSGGNADNPTKPG
jgi:hypothetical protein